MVNFDVILGMNWLSPYHVILNYFAKMVTLVVPNRLRVKWKGSCRSYIKKAISYIRV